MALHLAELWLNVESADTAKEMGQGRDGLRAGNCPPGVTKVGVCC